MEKNTKYAEIIDILNAHAIHEKRRINSQFHKLPVVGENKTMYYPLDPKEELGGILLPGTVNKNSRSYKFHSSVGIVVSSEKYPVGSVVFFTNKGAPGELIVFDNTAYQIIVNGSILCYSDGLEFLKANLDNIEWA